MLDAFIIEKLKKEKEPEREQWQPVPLPLEHPTIEEKNDKKSKKEHGPVTEIRF